MDMQQLWIESVGGIIVARMRGELSDPMMVEAHQRVLALATETGQTKVIYNALELLAPSIDLVVRQQELVESELASMTLRRALVVPNTRLAYLARLAFGDGEHRVFYNDLAAAFSWLQEPDRT
ncbi:hypothetical protein ACFSQU_20415 [Massilia sp. GCM10020059]|uniref:STAS/SEC14 domain-containing protein n=1 Tax=Massilia agrisoli TaxID=2892444 RepID=A0ABS8ITG4_9BURK|nr:hypothetical protein [Massilia agrisoli]MCC6071904.1 hypothetical protein [Massilia agrisoli]